MFLFSSLSQRTKTRILDVIDACGLELREAGGPLKYSFRRKEQFGADHLADMRTILGGHVGCVLDIGGHVGQTALRFADAFPEASIVSFEPDPDNFATLRRNVAGTPRIRAFNAAVGRTAGRATLHRNRGSQTHSLLAVSDGAGQFVTSASVLEGVDELSVEVVSLDNFLAEQAISRPDVLKADTQGYELEVLAGGTKLLAQRPAPLLYLEVSFVEQYKGQPLFEELYTWLYEHGYRLVGLYETGFRTHFYQVGANALFVHESMGARASK